MQFLFIPKGGTRKVSLAALLIAAGLQQAGVLPAVTAAKEACPELAEQLDSQTEAAARLLLARLIDEGVMSLRSHDTMWPHFAVALIRAQS